MANLKKPDICKQTKGRCVEYTYDGGDFNVTQEMKDVFDWDGCIYVRGLFDEEEVKKLLLAFESNPNCLKKSFGCADGTGRYSQLLLWNQPGNDVTGMVSRCEKVASTAEMLLGGEVYHYHTKLMMKDAKKGGTHLWHQDYGYWYQNGLLRPDVLTAYIALDPCTKENGCLQVIKGSQRCGRVEHALIHGQSVADTDRVEQIKKHVDMEHLFVEMNPGDCLFFHGNLLHTSTHNDSNTRRWTLLCAFNRADNDPIMKHHHASYTKLHKVPNNAVKECTNFTDLSGKDYMDPKAVTGSVIATPADEMQ